MHRFGLSIFPESTLGTPEKQDAISTKYRPELNDNIQAIQKHSIKPKTKLTLY